ncbi:MAG: hypothetical protein ACJ76U_17525 [Gaiellaceae bacterium]
MTVAAGTATPSLPFAWLYVAIVASAYIVSRGLAKAGSSQPYWADRGDLPSGRHVGTGVRNVAGSAGVPSLALEQRRELR